MPSRLSTGASPRARLLAASGLAALLAALALGRPGLVAFAALTLVPLLLADGAEPSQASVQCRAPAGQLVEGDPVEVTVRVVLDRPATLLWARLDADHTVAVEPGGAEARAASSSRLCWRAVLTPTRWGPANPPQLRVVATSRAGMRLGTTRVPLPLVLSALPRPVPVAPLRGGPAAGSRSGNHRTARAGNGIEFAGVRPFAPGDSLRRVNWPVTSRRGQLFVTDRFTEAGLDVVLIIDALAESGPRGASTLDASLRGAAGLSRSLLGNADRVGMVLLGQLQRWVAPTASARDWHRLAALALHAAPHDSYVTPDVDRIPPLALPSGALVVLFSPLLDERVLTVCADLHRRRFPTLVVDVLADPPGRAAGRRTGWIDRSAERLWRLERRSTELRLAASGVLVTNWDGAGALDVPLAAGVRR